MVEVRWTPDSLRDIEEIALFIAQDFEKYASIQAHRFFSAVAVLTQQPRIGRVVPEYMKQDLRELILGSYRIIYRIVSEVRVDIVTVHHSARSLDLSSDL